MFFGVVIESIYSDLELTREYTCAKKYAQMIALIAMPKNSFHIQNPESG